METTLKTTTVEGINIVGGYNAFGAKAGIKKENIEID